MHIHTHIHADTYIHISHYRGWVVVLAELPELHPEGSVAPRVWDIKLIHI